MSAPYCTNPFARMRVDCEGSVFMCCHQRTYPLGSLFKTPLAEIWFGEKAEKIREEIIKGVLPTPCRGSGCPYETAKRGPAKFSWEARAPMILELDLPNDHCNIGGARPSERRPACLMCERNLPNYRFHEKNRLPEILPELRELLPGLTKIHIQGIAEPFWKNALYEVLDGIGYGSFRDRIVVSTLTNGTLLNERKIRHFLSICPRSIVSFSIDASTPETYRKIRRLDAYDTVVKNVSTFDRMRNGNSNVVLRIQNNINTLNVDEIRGMIHFAKCVSADELSLSPTSGHPAEILVNKKNFQLFARAQKRAKIEARNLGVNLTFSRPLDMGFAKSDSHQ